MRKDNMSNKNTGDYNSGHFNSGNFNSGDYNSGDCNSGDYNSGDRNSGHFNSGDCNSGHFNSGWFNTNEPKMRFFNKDSEYTCTEFSEKFGFVYPDLHICQWVDKEDMTDAEKKEVSGWNEVGGYLKTLNYKEAWAEYWGRASKSDKQFFMNLPNFDADIFKEITGIDVEEKVEELTLAEVCKRLGKTVKIVKE